MTATAVRGVRWPRRRRLLATLAPLLVAGVVGLVAVDIASVPTRTGPAGTAGAAIAAVEVPRASVAPPGAHYDGPAGEQPPGSSASMLEPDADRAPAEPVMRTRIGEAIIATPAPRAEREDAAPTPAARAGRSGWVCDGTVRLVDPRHRRWSLGRVTFRAGPGFERVVLHIDRLGPHSGGTPTVTAETLATSRVRGSLPGVPRPNAGPTTVSLHLTEALETGLGLRGYRPRGLRVLKEFSVYPRARGVTTVLVSAAGDGCFRLSTPEWTERSRTTKQARIVLDVRA